MRNSTGLVAYMFRLTALLILGMVIFACKETDKEQKVSEVIAAAETTPVDAGLNDDAADDPAIWIHPYEPAQSTVIGTNKKSGLGVYSLDGKEKFFYPVGKINNVDVCYGFPLNENSTTDIAGGGNREDLTIDIFFIDSITGELTGPVEPRISIDTLGMDDAYGFCFYRNKSTNQFFAIVNDKQGIVQQWQINMDRDGRLEANLARHWKLDSQPEGMVSDHDNGYLFIGEENKGIWRFPACPDKPATGTFISQSDTSNPLIEYDIEGLALYISGKDQGYLIASSQGNNSFAVFERKPEHRFIGTFRIVDDFFDGTEETDGIEVSSYPLGDKFPDGLFVAQDGYNKDGQKVMPQNFKLVDWRLISEYFDPPLLIDTESYNPRN